MKFYNAVMSVNTTKLTFDPQRLPIDEGTRVGNTHLRLAAYAGGQCDGDVKVTAGVCFPKDTNLFGVDPDRRAV